MRNEIVTITILISILLLTVFLLKGVNIGKFEVLSIAQMQEKNNDLNDKLDEANKLTTEKFPEKVETLEKTFEEYNNKKEKYEQLSGLSSEEGLELYETKQYEITYLWRVLGNYAKKRYLTLGIDVQKADSSKSLYNLNFSVSGEYVKIIQFITDLENDSDLNFRIYNFKMSGSGTTVSASFKVENVSIDPSTINSSQNDSSNLFETKSSTEESKWKKK